jgi:5-hydroxyisourate hydrolase-like protein (transthyretin family)
MRLLALLVCGITACPALAGQASAPQSGPGTLQGQVLLEPGDQPMRKVSVELRSGGGEDGKKFSVTTDSGGRFKIDEVKPGTYRVSVFHEGYFRDYQREGQSTIVVQAGESNRELVFYMQRCAVITGTIVDADGDPLRGVSVTATMAIPGSRRGTDVFLGTVSTNDLGEFRVPDLIPTRYVISAATSSEEDVESTDGRDRKKERYIYATTYYPGTLNPEQAVPVEVHAGDEVAVHFGLLMTRVFRVNGNVTGMPAGSTGTQVMLTPKSSRLVEVDRESQPIKADGKFEFKSVVPGSYTARVAVVVNAGGRPSLQILRLSPAVEVNEANVEGVNLQPEPLAQIHGKFRMDNGQTIDWTQLGAQLISTTGEELQRISGMTGSVLPDLTGADGFGWLNKDGTFEMKNVPAGTFRLGIATQTNTLRDYFMKSVNLGGRDVADSGFFAGPDTNLDVVFSANGATIEGTVGNDQGQPVARVLVVAVPSAEHRMRPDLYGQGATDAKGRFLLRGLNPGEYTVLALEDFEEDLRQPEVMKKYEGKGENVTVEEGGKKSVTLKIIQAFDLHGQ